MGNQNIFKRAWNAIALFLATVFGISSRKLLADIRDDISEMRSENNQRLEMIEETMSLTHRAAMEQFVKMYGALGMVVNKPFFPILINGHGKLVNLAIQRDITCSVRFEPSGDYLLCELLVDKHKFETFRMDLTVFSEDHPAKPVFDFGRVMLKQRKEGLTSSVEAWTIIHIHNAVNKGQYGLTHGEMFDCFTSAYLDAVKPLYIKEERLADFIINKGPVYTPDDIRNEKQKIQLDKGEQEHLENMKEQLAEKQHERNEQHEQAGELQFVPSENGEQTQQVKE